MISRSSIQPNRSSRAIIAGLTLAAMLGSSASAVERFYVMRSGEKIRLTRSKNELGVILRDASAAGRCATRLSSLGYGTIRSLNGDPDCKVHILRNTETTQRRQSLVARDPDVDEVRPVYRFDGVKRPVVTTGTIVAKVSPGLSTAARAALWSEYGVSVVEEIDGQPHVYLLRPNGSHDDEVARAESLAADVRTRWAQPNLRRASRRLQVIPSDAFYNQQWYLNNTGQLGGTVDADIDAPEAWVLGEGQDIIIGMFDDACDIDHEDLREGYIGIGHDPSLPSNDAGFEDPRPKQIFDNHGTQVMGLAVARPNTLGVRGVAYQARFTVSRGLGAGLTDADIASVYTFARQQDVDVHINSWGIDGPNPAIVEDAIELAFTDGRNKGDLDGDGQDDRLGMVIVFATGNDNIELFPGFELSTLPQVIGVGASHDGDARASYSDFGEQLNFLAPSGDDFRAGVFTTDNTDRDGSVDDGANIGGVHQESGSSELDPSGTYTGLFSGTSASCPIAAGVAAVVLSINPLLSATDVRLVMEHTCDQISPDDADYDEITSRSLRYGYGRINAESAANAAVVSISNGGRTWPASPADVGVESAQIRWRLNVGTDEFLVLQSDSAFSFVPEDGRCYDSSQLGCSGASLDALPSGVGVLVSGCSLTCGDNEPGCDDGDDQCAEFLLPAGRRYFAVYARSNIGRYSFGVSVDSDGNVAGSGTVLGDVGGSGGGSTITDDGVISSAPAVTIQASPLEGDSPLTVQFRGNAVSDIEIDDSRTVWDFDIEDGILNDSSSRVDSHTYIVAAGQTRTFVARLTMYDIEDNVGTEQISIRVDGPQTDEGGGLVGSSDLRIIVGVPGSPDSDEDEGTSPFDVLLSVDASAISGDLQSISWDLGDGTRANSLVVPHTYVNESEETQRIAISAIVITTTSGGTTNSSVATKLLTVHPGEPETDLGDPNLVGTGAQGPGGPASPCGAMGMVALIGLLGGIGTLRLARRRRVR